MGPNRLFGGDGDLAQQGLLAVLGEQGPIEQKRNKHDSAKYSAKPLGKWLQK